MKLIAIKLPSIPILGDLGNVTLDRPHPRLVGWIIALRGPAVFLVSPNGWAPGKAFVQLDPKGKRRVFEVPRAECVIDWEVPMDDIAGIDGAAKYTSTPLELVREPEPDVAVAAPVIDDEELERQTAPKRAGK